MATNKITSNELKTLVKQIIKETTLSHNVDEDPIDDYYDYDEPNIVAEFLHDLGKKTGYNEKLDIIGRELYQLENKKNILFKEKALRNIVDFVKILKVEMPKKIKDFNIQDKKQILGYIYQSIGVYGPFKDEDDFIDEFLDYI